MTEKNIVSHKVTNSQKLKHTEIIQSTVCCILIDKKISKEINPVKINNKTLNKVK